MNKPITMRELQKLSAKTIEDLTEAVPIKSGDRTVAILQPVHRPAALTSKRRKEIADATAKIDAWQASWTPEQRRIVDQILEERGIADWA